MAQRRFGVAWHPFVPDLTFTRRPHTCWNRKVPRKANDAIESDIAHASNGTASPTIAPMIAVEVSRRPEENMIMREI